MPCIIIKSRARRRCVYTKLTNTTRRYRVPLASDAWAHLFGFTFKHEALPDSKHQMFFMQEIIPVILHILERDENINILDILDAEFGPRAN